MLADTNVYLHHPEPFDRIDWTGLLLERGHTGVHLLVPLVVVDELDRQKQGQSDRRVVRGGTETVRTRARITIRTLEDLFADPDAVATVSPEPSPVRAELLVDPPRHVRLPSADAEIVDTARAMQDLYGSPVTVVTRDTGMLFRARAAGLPAVRLAEPPED